MSRAPSHIYRIADPITRAVERFLCKVQKGKGHDNCWEWTAAKDADGYGTFQLNGKKERAHRVAAKIIKGASVDGVLVRHSCDNPGCVNPAHLLIGTHAQNVADRVARERSARAARHGSRTKPEAFEQAHASRRRLVAFRGEVLTLNEIAARLRIPLQPLKRRLSAGWDIERAISEPPRCRGRQTTPPTAHSQSATP